MSEVHLKRNLRLRFVISGALSVSEEACCRRRLHQLFIVRTFRQTQESVRSKSACNWCGQCVSPRTFRPQSTCYVICQSVPALPVQSRVRCTAHPPGYDWLNFQRDLFNSETNTVVMNLISSGTTYLPSLRRTGGSSSEETSTTVLTSLTARRPTRTPETGRSSGPGLRAGPRMEASSTRSPRWPQTRTCWRPTGRRANGQRSQRALGHLRHCHVATEDAGTVVTSIH